MTHESHAEDSCLKNQSRPGQADPITGPEGPSGTAGQHGPGHDPEKAPAFRYGDSGAAGAHDAVLTRQETNLDFPEGGLQAWLVVFGSFCAMLSVFGLINTAAVFESYLSTNQLSEYSSDEIGWIFSLYLFVVFFVGIQVGPIFDKYGPRIVVAIGGVLIAGSLLIFSVCEGRTTPRLRSSGRRRLNVPYYRLLPNHALLLGRRRTGRRSAELASIRRYCPLL